MKTRLSDRIDQMRIVADNSPYGGVIKIPVARHASVSLAGTAGGGNGTLAVDDAMFSEIVDNFARKPGPVPVYFGHDNSAPRKPDTPAIGFVTDVWAEGDTLWNEIKLSPRAWDLIVTQRGFAAASIEAQRDKETPTGAIDGWSQCGLSITNTPALDVQYLAAESGESRRESVHLSAAWLNPVAEEVSMTEVNLETLKADKLALEAKLKAATDETTAEKAKIAELKAEVAELSKRPTPEMLLSLEQKVKSIEAAQLASDVKVVIASAIAAGKPPAFFEGADADPVRFLNERFGGNLAALKASAEKLPAVAKMANSGTGSGAGTGATGSAKDRVLAETQKLQAEGKAKTFNEALELVKKSHPALYAEMAEGYRPVAASE